MSKISVAFVAPRFHTNQAPIVKRFVELGYQVYFYVVEKEFTEDYSVINPIIIKPNIVYLYIRRLLRVNIALERKILVPSFRFLWYIFLKKRPDITIIRNPHYIYSFVFVNFAKLCGSKVLIYSQDSAYCYKRSTRQQLYHYLTVLYKIKWITPVLGNVGFSKTSKNIYYVPLVSNASVVNKKNNLRECNCYTILMIGKFLEWKRHILLIKVIQDLITLGKKIKLTIIGECTKQEHFNYLEKVQQFIRNNGLNRHITIKVNIHFRDMNQYYENADIFVLPSVGEMYSISPLEAMSKGLPVIVSSENGFQYHIKDGYNGYVFKKDDANDLKEKISYTLSKKFLIELSNNCIQYTKVNHHPDIYINKILEILNIRKRSIH